ncbi:hypothetical protein FKM82_013735 [Ascaphus truei]
MCVAIQSCLLLPCSQKQDIPSPGIISGLSDSPSLSLLTDQDSPGLRHAQPARDHRDRAQPARTHQEHLASIELSKERLLEFQLSRHQKLLGVHEQMVVEIRNIKDILIMTSSEFKIHNSSMQSTV